MFCGYLKQTCRSITVKELIDILELCKNKDATVQLLGTTNFFIHFDQDGAFIDFTKNAEKAMYGNAGANGTCESCRRFDRAKNVCGCDGKNCFNCGLIVDTEKLNELHSREEVIPTVTESRASREPISNNKYDLSEYGINGATFNSNQNREENKKEKYTTPEDIHNIQVKTIQTMVDNAILSTLGKMMNGIKGDK